MNNTIIYMSLIPNKKNKKRHPAGWWCCKTQSRVSCFQRKNKYQRDSKKHQAYGWLSARVLILRNHIHIIGSGFAGLSAACFMAKAGWQVTVIEKLPAPGGRAGRLTLDGFQFDMGPSWYWMPDIFERFFAQFGKKVSDFYSLQRLDPSYRVYWKDGMNDIPATMPALEALFESIEPGSSRSLRTFLAGAAYKYETGMKDLAMKPGRSVREFLHWPVLRGLLRLSLFSSVRSHVNHYFKSDRIRMLMEFPSLFLGALPANTPALYSLMNYADMQGGTWYPAGGMYRVVESMHELALSLGVQFDFNQEVIAIHTEKGEVSRLRTRDKSYETNVVISGADYHFTESLLPSGDQSYTTTYWERRKMAPSCLLYFIGLNKKVPGLRHHTLFFDESFEDHARDIYHRPDWPAKPLFYVSATSVTDPTAAPPGCENLFFLIPVAAALTGDSDELRARYFNMILQRMEKRYGVSMADAIMVRKDFAVHDFEQRYHSFKGNAYGLANTLSQTALLKPSCKSKKLKNLYYCGQLTVPGPGVPPSLVSGEIAAKEVLKKFR